MPQRVRPAVVGTFSSLENRSAFLEMWNASKHRGVRVAVVAGSAGVTLKVRDGATRDDVKADLEQAAQDVSLCGGTIQFPRKERQDYAFAHGPKGSAIEDRGDLGPLGGGKK